LRPSPHPRAPHSFPTRRSSDLYDVPHPNTGLPCKVPERGWIYASADEMQRQIKLGLVVFRDDNSEPPFRKANIRPIPDEVEADRSEEHTSELQSRSDIVCRLLL